MEKLLTKKIDYEKGDYALIDELNDENHGWWISFNADNSKKWERHYLNGKKNGPERVWFTSGQLKSECNFIDDELNGLWKTWYSNGNLKNDTYFTNGNQSHYSRWYDNKGIKITECRIYNNQKNGTEIARIIINDETLETSLAIVTHEFGNFKGFKEIAEMED